MRSRVAINLVLLFLSALSSASALAAECEIAPLSPEQQQFLADNQLTVNKPQGDVTIIQRCDTNADKMVDILDIRAISAARGNPATHMNDPMDWDKNGLIDVLDARGCQQLCGLPRCAINPTPPDEQVDGVLDVAECFQAEDTDEDGQVDQIITITQKEPVADESEPVKLSLVIMREVEGEVEFYKDSFAGYSQDGKVVLHVVKQPAGIVNLNPGTVEIDEPGTMSFHGGEPKILYYWKDGRLRRAPYGVDD
jgi:hypothetical protein